MLQDQQQKVQNMSLNLSTSQASLSQSMSESYSLTEIKSELSSLKGLLLNRRQFPSPVVQSSPFPSIPAWQRNDTDSNEDTVESNLKDLQYGSKGCKLLVAEDTMEEDATSKDSVPHPKVKKEEWKLANIIPIRKKGDISNVENYRPISLLCVTSKVLERCVLRNLRDYLMSLINSAQHGFIPARSCTTQLVEVLHYIGSILDSGKQTDIIFMDMSKAFDKVSHTALINKLQQYNIGGSLLQWFTSYLRDRQQRVTTLGATSSKKPVCSGVPQGSILGPILFLLYVNDLPDAVTNSTVACFADDTKIFRRIDSITDAMLLQDDINNLQSCSTSSGLVFNEGKCKSISITRRSQPIHHLYSIKGKELALIPAENDLGIWITSDLTWSKHILDRTVPADNSCLFASISYVMLGITSFSGQLRNLIVTAVSNDPVTFNEAFLGRSNKDYCDWIANPERWG
ncbi:Hypothetical predicted protein, partial [Paramuricea clavata]